jgi:hypothetical protein
MRQQGCVLCRITGKDEKQLRKVTELLKEEGLSEDAKYWLPPPVREPAKWTISPWVGQEVGFILASDSEDNRGKWSFLMWSLEFLSSLSFKLPKDGALKVFVTSVFSGRIRQVGSAVFARDGTLLGIISGVEKYEYDVGRRAVVKTLLGFPKFTKPKLKPAEK